MSYDLRVSFAQFAFRVIVEKGEFGLRYTDLQQSIAFGYALEHVGVSATTLNLF